MNANMCGKTGLILLGPLYLSRQNYNKRTQIGKKVCMTLAEPESYCYLWIYRRKLAISYKTQLGEIYYEGAIHILISIFNMKCLFTRK